MVWGVERQRQQERPRDSKKEPTWLSLQTTPTVRHWPPPPGARSSHCCAGGIFHTSPGEVVSHGSPCTNQEVLAHSGMCCSWGQQEPGHGICVWPGWWLCPVKNLLSGHRKSSVTKVLSRTQKRKFSHLPLGANIT